MKCHWTIKENIWKPSVRIGSALTLCANNRLYLFGGYNRLATNDLYYIDPKKAEWITVQNIKSKRPPERYGHTALFYKNTLLIFGGE
jgi:N-acetylneuraminic acid mutarotase